MCLLSFPSETLQCQETYSTTSSHPTSRFQSNEPYSSTASYIYVLLHTATNMSRAPSNPFYPSNSTSPPPAGPPSYNAATRPVPAVPSEPVSYTSLSDLTRGKQQQAAPSSGFSYQPSSQRAGYRDERFGESQTSQQGQAQGSRRNLPPDPTINRDKSLLPPKRNVPRKYRSLLLEPGIKYAWTAESSMV